MLNIISYLAIIFLSLFGYSCSVITRSGRRDEQPGILDLFLVLIPILGALITGSVVNINRWYLLLASIGAAIILGLVRASIFTRHRSVSIPQKRQIDNTVWSRWLGFSTQAGSFQTRLIMSYVYYFLILFVAIPMKILSDPLEIKNVTKKSYWKSRSSNEKMEQAVKQY